MKPTVLIAAALMLCTANANAEDDHPTSKAGAAAELTVGLLGVVGGIPASTYAFDTDHTKVGVGSLVITGFFAGLAITGAHDIYTAAWTVAPTATKTSAGLTVSGTF